MDTHQSLSLTAEDVRLLQLYPDGVVPEWNVALCKMMLSEGSVPRDGESYLRLQRVVVSGTGGSWTAFDGAFSGGAYALYKWITQADAEDEYEHYRDATKKWYGDFARRVKEAHARAMVGTQEISSDSPGTSFSEGDTSRGRTRLRDREFRVPVAPIMPILEAQGVEMNDISRGYAVCPGVELHTTPNALHDCIVYNNDGIPFLHCFHQSCLAVRQAVNATLYKAASCGLRVVARSNDPQAIQARDRAYHAKCDEIDRERHRAKATLPHILRDYDWPEQAITAESPESIELPVERHWQLLLCLFMQEDVVWIGRDKFDSGSPGHRWRFRASDDWLRRDTPPGTLVCPSAFSPGVHRRSIKNVSARRFLVVESDVLARNQIGAVFRWIEEYLELPLRAVVDTGNKSLHGWFNYPPPHLLPKLRMWLPAMGCDPAMFAPNQPCRLPGVIRPETGRPQRLLYLR